MAQRPRYVLKGDAMRLIADTDPDFRWGPKGEQPNISAISVAAGFDASTLHHVLAGRYALSAEMMAALVSLYMAKRRVGRATAEKALFDLEPADEPARALAVAS